MKRALPVAAAIVMGVTGISNAVAQAPAPTLQGATVQTAPAQPQAVPEDAAALSAIMSAQPQTVADLDKRMTAIEEFALKFPNSMYKAFAFSMAGQSAQMKGDRTRAIFFYDKAVAADPKDHVSMLMIAAETAQGTGENDLRKEEKLGRAEKLVADALALIPAATKPNPQISDEQWAQIKKDDTSQAYEATGLIAMARKKYDDAAAAFRKSIDVGVTKQPATYVRLGGALDDAKRYDEAAKVLDEVIAMPNVPDQIKQVAQSEKTRGQQLKALK